MKLTRPPRIASLCFIVSISILLVLGTWQIQRLEWKENLLVGMRPLIEGNVNYTPIDLNKIPTPPENHFFKVGSITGQFLFDKEIYLGPRSQTQAFHLKALTPLITPEGKIVIVQRGYVHEQHVESLRAENVLNTSLSQTLNGYFKTPLVNHWMNRIIGLENDPQNNLWYHADLEQIADALNLKDMLPAIFIIQNGANQFLDTDKQAFEPPNNNHLQYALFWFSMAIALSGIFIVRFCLKK